MFNFRQLIIDLITFDTTRLDSGACPYKNMFTKTNMSSITFPNNSFYIPNTPPHISWIISYTQIKTIIEGKFLTQIKIITRGKYLALKRWDNLALT